MLGDLWNAIKTVARWLLLVCTHPAWGTLNATRFHYRDQIWPLAILAILAVARLLVSGATPSSVFLLFFLLSTAILFYLRRKLGRAVEWIYAGCCLGGVVLGLTLISGIGTDDRFLNFLCIAGWAIGAIIWWRHHEVRGHTPAVATPIIDLWDTHIGVDIKAEKEAERRSEAAKKATAKKWGRK